MLRSFRKTWLLLFLIPYLFYAGIGLSGHNHNNFRLSQTNLYSNCTVFISNSVNNNGDSCPACFVQDAFNSCGSLLIPTYSVELIKIENPPCAASFIQRTVSIFTPSRAPPTLAG
ncbi:MAG: hypothetical protein WCO98_05005 [bacterium]